MKSEGWEPLNTCRLMKSEGWVPLWVDADSKKCQIQMVKVTKKTGTLFLLYTLSTQGGAHLGTISLRQAVGGNFLKGTCIPKSSIVPS